jgi:hypothetical protein
LEPKYVFESYPPYRRTQLYLSLPEKHRPEARVRDAKFVMQLDKEQAMYGFYVEKNGGPIDETWDWTRFVAIIESPQMQTEVESAMQRHDLVWVIDEWDLAHKILEQRIAYVQGTTSFPASAATQLRPFRWNALLEHLHQLRDACWCDLWLLGSMTKQEAIAARTSFAATVARVYQDLLPLYLKSVRKT